VQIPDKHLGGGPVRRSTIAFAAGMIAATAGGASSQTYQERGAYLVNALAVCGNCHTPGDAANQPIPAMALAGGFAFDEAALGHIVGPNITPDKETGIGSWTIGQIVNAVRNGKRPDGTIIGAPMPFDFYRQLSDRDAEAIAIYLKSLKPVRHEVPRSQYKIPLPPAYGPIVGHVAEPDRKDGIAYGGYLAGPVAHCLECHTPRNKDGLVFARFGAGGRELPDFGNPGGLTLSRNITPDPETGIGRWSDADVKRAILVGERPDGTKLSITMPSAAYNAMTSDDVNAIVDYLRSLNPVRTE
jgi:mono/diheme cytochrome c family protein